MKSKEFSALVIKAFSKECLKKLVFSRPSEGEIQKVTARLCRGRRGTLLAFEYSLPGNTVSQKNLLITEVESELGELTGRYSQANLITTLGDAEFKRSKSGKEIILRGDALLRKLDGGSFAFESAIEELDKKKNYILDGTEDFLIKLGISSADGRVHDKKQAKFRQINRFLEHIEEIYPRLPKDGELRVFDLCCGKSYLSFAVYYYLTVKKGREVYMYCADLKRDVILWCEGIGRELSYNGMHFEIGDIRALTYGERADMVISLHACDVATDIVLEVAANLCAEVILSTPCCHKNMKDHVRAGDLSFVTRYPHLSNKMCDALTDALRAAWLEARGYSVSALELTDPDDTPKNTLIRAIKHSSVTEKQISRAQDEYRRILGFLFPEGADGYLDGIGALKTAKDGIQS